MQVLNNKIKKTIPIVFSVDKNYIPYLSVTIQSVIQNSNHNNIYEIYVLHLNISEFEQLPILGMAKDNIKINFINVNDYIDKYKNLLKTSYHFTEAIYYRLIIPMVFSDYNKILYLDCDLVINFDIADLYKIELADNYIAAVKDISMQYKQFGWDSYAKKIGIALEKYINSGVILINIHKIKEINIIENAMNILKDNKFLFPDQDILNILCKGKILYLDYKYNFQWYLINCPTISKDNFIDNKTFDEYMQAGNNPYIIHYTSSYKPWNNIELKYNDYFWNYARFSPYYEKLLFNAFRKYILEFLKPNWFKYYEYKIKSSIPYRKQIHYKDKFKRIHKRYRDIGLIKK